MKKIIMFAVCLLVVSCGGGGGSGAPTAENLDEGTGATLDLSGSASGNTTDTEVVVKSILDQTNNTFNLSTSKAMSVKSIDTTSELYKMCTTNSYTQTINKQISGTSGTADFTGSISMSKTSADQASINENISGTFDNFKYYGSTKDVTIDGTATVTGSGTMTKGLKALCDAAMSGQDPGEFAVAINTHQQSSGTFSISGEYGAAISFTVSTDVSIDSEAKIFSLTTSGSASVKSDGKTVACTINGSLVGSGGDDDLDSASYKVICK